MIGKSIILLITIAMCRLVKAGGCSSRVLSKEGLLCGKYRGNRSTHGNPAGMDLKMQSHPAGRSGIVMLLSGTVGSGFTCVPSEMAVNIF